MESNRHTFKKGDSVYSYCLSPEDGNKDEEGRALVCAQALILTSMGKRQGTATYSSNGKILARRIYPETQLVADLETVMNRARSEYFDYSRKLIARYLEMTNEWIVKYEFKSPANVVARAKARRNYLMTAQPSCRIWVQDGEHVTETFLPTR